MTMNKHDRKEGRSANIGFAKWRVKYLYDSLVQGSSSVFQMKFCAENPPLRKAENRFEPSSKVCSNCGNYKKDLKLSDRTYDCDKCGNSMDRDLNASLNIKNFGVRDNPLYANVNL